MTMAEDLYDEADKIDSPHKEDAFHRKVKSLAISYKRETLSNVVYYAYRMPDMSVLVWGENGYIGLSADGK